MNVLNTKSTVKVIGTNGQISLGKEFAGRQVLVEEHERGVWMIRTASIIPDNELWLHTSSAQSDLQRALGEFEKTAPEETDLDALLTRLNTNGEKQSTTRSK
jgi:hypothetical protein